MIMCKHIYHLLNVPYFSTRVQYICTCVFKDDDMNTRKRLKKFISCIRCVINKLKRFSIEMEDEYDIEDEYTDCDDGYYLESEFETVIKDQREKLEDLSVDMNRFIDDYSGDYDYELEQAVGAIYCACAELDEISANFYPWNCSGDCNREIVNTVEYLNDVIDSLESAIEPARR